MPAERYADRIDAGRRLARELADLQGEDALVLALPRGGVPVAAQIADALGAELDVLVARKLGAPMHPELGVGAIAPGGVRIVDQTLLQRLGIQRSELDVVEARERAELERRVERYRGDRPAPRVEGRVVILVDDGIATGGTARAAIESVRAQRPKRLILAVPVAPPEAVAALAPLVDELVCPLQPRVFHAVGEWYDEFDQTDDEKVIALLAAPRERELTLDLGGARVGATLVARPGDPLVIFAHGAGSSRRSPRNRAVAESLRQRGLGTLLLDLLTEREEREQDLRFDIDLLSRRLVAATRWARSRGYRVAFFGSSTGAAAALVAAAQEDVSSVVSRGGRPDLAGSALPRVHAPTLLLVGGADRDVLALNKQAMSRMQAPARLDVIPGATHLFEEPGALDQVAQRAGEFLADHFRA